MEIERRLRFRRPGVSAAEEIVVSVGFPYFPAKALGMEQFHGCYLSLGDASGVCQEAFGIDYMQALGAALRVVQIYLERLSEIGELTLSDGTLYDPRTHGPIPGE